MFNLITAAVIAATIFFAPTPPAQPAYPRPARAYLPLVIGQDVGPRTETFDVIPPGIWVHVRFIEEDAYVFAQALIYNPAHLGGLWTVLSPIDEGWYNIRYRLEWEEVPGWITAEAWQPVLAGAPEGPHPEWWHEQHVFRLRGEGYEVDHFFIDLP